MRAAVLLVGVDPHHISDVVYVLAHSLGGFLVFLDILEIIAHCAIVAFFFEYSYMLAYISIEYISKGVP